MRRCRREPCGATFGTVTTLRFAVLGDSIGYGVGAGRTADTLAARLTTHLTSEGLVMQPRVFAVPGARSADLTRQVDRAVAWGPDVALVVIGANDLTHLVPARDAAAALQVAVRRLRHTGAEVVVAPAPDMSIVPHVPAAFRDVVRIGSRRLREAQIRVTLTEGGRVADEDGSTSATFRRDRSLFSSDHFHPSSKGYGVIAGAVAPIVRAAALAVTLE